MTKVLGISHDGVFRLEKRSDAEDVEAMGGNLSLVSEFPDRDPVVLSGIAKAEPRENFGVCLVSITRELEN